MRHLSAAAVFALAAAAATDPAAAQPAAPKVTTIKLNKLSAPPPAGWASEKPKYTLRSYQFAVPGVKEAPAGEFIVMPESDPKADKMFPRWRGQFQPGAEVKESKLALKDATAELLDVSGTWKYKERPFDPKSKEEEKVDYRVVWAVVVEKDEATHVRLSGPKAVVDKHYPAFEAWLKALK